MADKIRAAIIGLGWPGNEHLKGYVACPRTEVVAICDWDEPLLHRIGDQYGIAQRFTDYKEMIARDDIDAISIAVPNYEHAELTIDCLDAGKHVLCEKPPAMNAAEARSMAEAARRNARTLMYALVMRFRPEVRYLKALVEAGELGRIYLGKAGYTRRRGIPRGKDNWFIDKRRAGGGALIDIGVHALDCVWYLMGTPRPVHVMGAAYHEFGATVPAGITFDVDDAAMGLIRFDNGATLFLEASWAWNLPGKATKMIAGTRGGADLEPFRLFTEKNGVTLDTELGQAGMPEGYGDAPANPFCGEVAHFAAVIAGAEQLLATPEQGVQMMQMLDAIYASAESGEGVTLS